MGIKLYGSKGRYRNARHANLTHEDRIKLHNCAIEKRALTPKERREIFGNENPEFIHKIY